MPKIGYVKRLNLRKTHPEEPESDDDLVAKADHGPVLAGRYQLAESLLTAEPPSRIARLHPSVGPAVGPQRPVNATETVGGTGLDDPLSDAPSEEGTNPGAALVDRIVRRVSAGAERDQVGFYQLARMPSSCQPEQLPESSPVGLGRPRVRVAGSEPVKDAEQVGNSRCQWPHSRRRRRCEGF
jgi:hypothetical protein